MSQPFFSKKSMPLEEKQVLEEKTEPMEVKPERPDEHKESTPSMRPMPAGYANRGCYR